ncbi:MAG: ergothioneine biosynthesis protein EgtB [Sphingomonadaceae bacterium]
MDASLAPDNRMHILQQRYLSVRARTLALLAPLSDADATVQSMPDASPAKWHAAHTTWFFETFILRDHVRGYRLYDPQFPFLFNSYYETEGARIARAARGMLTRPTLKEVRAWRAHVDQALVAALPELADAALQLVQLGCHHEEQHQELLLTDILHLFSTNPLEPALFPAEPTPASAPPRPIGWLPHPGGIVEIGDDGETGFVFDCEGPRHQALLHPHALADRCVTNGEWAEFIADGGYRSPRHWLSDGWAWVCREGIDAPLYWKPDGKSWTSFGLHGRHRIDPAAPVTHISFYEADAYACWAGCRLPTEEEWEEAAGRYDPAEGQQFEAPGSVSPRPETGPGFFGTVWEWTGSPYRPWPGFRPAKGAVGEYNGKFMSGQFVLRGGSCATPRGHIRASYRNFFYPHQRWQFTGLRLAKDV